MDIMSDPTLSDDKLLQSSIDNPECHPPVSSTAANHSHTISEMLEHRKLLLDRIITCRKAAELALHQNTLFPEDVTETTTTDTEHRNEVQMFRDMCRQATQSMGLKRSNSVLSVPQRGSMSMRKSTTGRKDFSFGRSASVGVIDENKAGAFTTLEDSNRRYSSLDNTSLTHSMDIEMTHVSNNVTFVNMTDTLPNHGMKDSKHMKRNSFLNAKRPMPAKMARSMSNPNSLLEFLPGSNKPLDPNDTTDYDSQRFQKSPVLLEQLRNQRQNILSQLEVVAKKRRASLQGKFQCLEESSPEVSRKPSKKKSHATTESSSSPPSPSSMDPNPVMLLPHQAAQPPYFPSRMKTQWDYVLEEMRWLATDYVEERKWKRVHSRVRSEAIRLHFIDSYKKQSSPTNHNTTQVSIMSSPKKQRPVLVTTSLEDTLEIESNPESTMNEIMVGTRFKNPSVQDIDLARDVARIQSLHVERYWNTFRSKHDFVNSEEGISTIYNPYMHLDASMPEYGNKRSRTVGDTTAFTSNGESTDLTKEVELTHDEITSQMNHILDHLKQVVQRVQDIPEATHINEFSPCGDSMKPYSTQVHAMYHFQHAWSSQDETRITRSPGLILSGAHSCGKTVTISAILWKLKSNKPHLILCPTISMIRWKYELEKFFGSNVFIYRNNSWFEFTSNLSSSNDPLSEKNTVILCEAADYKQLIKDLEQKSSAETLSNMFSTIVIDTRCCLTDTKAALNSARGLQSSSLRNDSCSVCQVQSCSWWNELTTDFQSCNAKRVIVERDLHLSTHGIQELECDEKSRSELLSAKLAFLLNPIFHSIKGSPWKKLISWARRHLQIESFSSSVKTSGIRAALSHLQAAFIYHLQYPSTLLHQDQFNLQHRLEPTWSIRLCSCSRSQRLAYDKVLIYVRGSLSTCTQSRQSDSEYVHRSCLLASKALLWIRRICFFAGDESEGRVQQSFSQPNIEMADFIIDRSAKLKELLLFFQETCGYSSSSYEEDKKVRNIIKKKILILASLPEVIRITSLFLNALGIRNEIVGGTNSPCGSYDHPNMASVDPSCSSDGLSSDDIRDRQYCQTIRDQRTIRRFIESTNLDVLIGDPLSLGHQYSGLTASSADYVVSLDEDWSSLGRSNIDDILMKNFICHQEGRRTQFIKLVVENTYDQIFVSPQSINDPVIVSHTRADTSTTDERQLLMIKAQIPSIVAENFNTFLCLFGSVELGSSPNLCLHRNYLCSSKRRIQSDFDSDSAREIVRTRPFSYDIHKYLRRTNLISVSESPRVDKITSHANNLAPQESDIDDFYEPTDHLSLGTVLDLLTYSLGNLSDVDLRNGTNAIETHYDRIKLYAEEGLSLHRRNLYSLIYKMALPPRDGKQGVDKLLYFPPLFPSLLEFIRITAANDDQESINKQKSCALNPQNTQSGKKRKASQGNSSSKRIRLRDAEFNNASAISFPSFDNTFPSSLPEDMLDSVDLGLLTGDDPVLDSEAADIFDVDMTLSDPPSCRTRSIFERDDLGLIGKGDLPPLSASINAALEQSVQATGVAVFLDPYNPYSNAFQEENSAIGTLSLPPLLEAFILYMKTAPKKTLSFMNGVLGRSNSMPTITRPTKVLNSTTSMAIEGTPSQSSLSLSLSDYTDCQPKVMNSTISSKLFSIGIEQSDSIGIPSGQGTNQLTSANTKAPQQNQSTAKSKRHDSYSSIIFSGGHKGQPYVNFRRHVMNRLVEKYSTEIDENSLWFQGLQAVQVRENAGDNVTTRTQANRLLHQTMNFGPFSTGFVSSTFSNEINPIIPKVCGIELPMGVRIPHISTNVENYQGRAAWSDTDDRRLRMLAIDLTGNWNLIRMAITDYKQIGNDYHHFPVRSAHQCEEKWNSLIREKHPVHESLNENDLGRSYNDGSSLSKSLLSTTSTNSRESYTESVQVFMKANLKRRRMQISLPGPSSNGGSASLPVVNPHPSHTQSVLDALGPNGGQMRSEMWPLQLLDNIEKQHQSNINISSSSSLHLSSPGIFHQQQGTTKKTSSVSPVNNHNAASRSHLPGNGSRSPQNRSSNNAQPTSSVGNHPQYPPPYRYPVPDTT